MVDIKVRGGRWRSAFEVSTTIAMLGLASVLIWPTRFGTSGSADAVPIVKAFAPPADPVPVAQRPSLGSPHAPAVMILYADFECMFCARFATETLPTLTEEYVDTGQLRIVFKHFPLANHARAEAAAVAATCAWQQGIFWPMHDELFAQPGRLLDTDLLGAAQRLSLDLDRVESCMGDDRTKAFVAADKEEAEVLGIRATPSFLLGTAAHQGVRVTELMVGAKSVDVFRAWVDRLLETL